MTHYSVPDIKQVFRNCGTVKFFNIGKKDNQLEKKKSENVEAKDLAINKQPSYNEEDIFIDQEDDEERLQKQQEERQRRIQEILAKHKNNEESQVEKREEKNEKENIEESKEEITKHEDNSSSSNADNDEVINKMDEANVQLLKLLEKERTKLKKSASKMSEAENQEEVKEDEANQDSDNDSFDMFNVNSDDENNNLIDKAVGKGIQIQDNNVNVDADGYYQPKVGEIISGK